MLKSILINSIPRSQKALARLEEMARITGMSKSQCAVYLIETAPQAKFFDQKEPNNEQTANL